MSSDYTDRRSVLKAIGGVAASAAMMGTAAASDGRGGAHGDQPFHQQLKKVEEATKRYKDMDQALQEGYKIMGPYVPGMGWHLTNPDYVRKAAQHGPNLVEPPIVTYNLRGELGAVEYAVPIPSGHEEHDHHTYDLFNDEESDHPHDSPTEEQAWHIHGKSQHIFSNQDEEYNPGEVTKDELLTPKFWMELSSHNSMFPEPDWSLGAGDTITMDGQEVIIDILTVHPSMTTLHAWVHYENPDGVFKGQNPNFDPIYNGGEDSESGDHEH